CVQRNACDGAVFAQIHRVQRAIWTCGGPFGVLGECTIADQIARNEGVVGGSDERTGQQQRKRQKKRRRATTVLCNAPDVIASSLPELATRPWRLTHAIT
ncbi:hypothetical protein, partial [Acinetobacter baumannii]|uniref:hypothetical protein n=1 Tax=Acinetobacter baumannii TaxID=470 RepID=UPI001EF0C5FB